MNPPRTTLRRKLVAAIMSTSTLVLLIVGTVFVVYEYVSIRTWLVRHLAARAGILAANSTAALAFRNPEDARKVLAGLRHDPAMSAGALYDANGVLFALWPDSLSAEAVPATPPRAGHRFRAGTLEAFVPVREGGLWLGTIMLRSNLRALDERLGVVITVMLIAILASIGIAFILSSRLQRRISGPVLELAGVARAVSERQDYSVRSSVTSDDELGHLVATFNDMLGQIQRRDSALQSSEARQRAILESALDAVITMEEDGRIVEFNPAAERLFGMSRAGAIGTPLPELAFPERLRASHRDTIVQHLARGRDAFLRRRLELTARRADGREMPVEIAIARIPQPGPAMYTAFIRDISERKEAEAEIRGLNQDLENRVRVRTAELESFSYSVSHDLRAPLRAIDGFSKALLDDSHSTLSENGVRYLERVRAAARNMGHLIDGLLNLSRLSRAAMSHGTVDLSALARDVAAGLRQAQPDRDVTIVVADGVTVEGDSQLLRIVLDNLLGNAWKFTSRKASARIEFGCEWRDGAATFFIRDDGAGFDMAHAALLFAPFQRLHRHDEFEGTGVGLATVHRIIERHRGRLWAESAVGQGATFYFTLWERKTCD